MGAVGTGTAIVELCTSEDGVARACETIEAMAEKGQWQELSTLARSLEEAAAKVAPAARIFFETVTDHVEDHLALCPGDAAVDAMLDLAGAPRRSSIVVPRPESLRARAFASRLGFGQKPEALLAALERRGGEPAMRELLACWLHEVVLRGHALDGEAAAVRFHEALAAAGHPLGGLPLALRSPEREAPSYMPLYGDASLGTAIEALANAPRAGHTIPPPADATPVVATPRAADPRLGEAVKPWAEGHKGKVEARIFDLAEEVGPNAAGSWLVRALPLEATAAAEKLRCVRVVDQGAFGALFAAAANGGAWSAGLGGAYGRLAAWTSFAALVDAPATVALDRAGLDTIEARAAGAVHLSFRAAGPWFHDVAWDLGLLTLRSDGRSVAVLAATDA